MATCEILVPADVIEKRFLVEVLYWRACEQVLIGAKRLPTGQAPCLWGGCYKQEHGREANLATGGGTFR